MGGLQGEGETGAGRIAGTACAAEGEVVDREERLAGEYVVVLDGTVLHGDEPASGREFALSGSLSWTLGREGAVELTDGDLTIAAGDEAGGAPAAELNARLTRGTVVLDADTALATVNALFEVEEDVPGGPAAGAMLRCRLEVGAERWSGEIGPA